jgi:hypothetical protein
MIATVDDFGIFGNLEKPSKVCKFNDDPIALSCYAWRQAQQGYSPYQDFELCKPELVDREMALKVRKHFLDKLTLARLRSEQMSPFRIKLGAWLVGNHELVEKDIGLVYQLPYFYIEDLKMVEICTDVETVPAHVNGVRKDHVLRLTPWTTLDVHRRGNQTTQFWFKDEYNQGVRVVTRKSDEFYQLLNSFMNFNSLTVMSYTHARKFFDSEKAYLQLRNVRLLAVN